MGTSVSRAAQAHIRTIFAVLSAFALALCLLPATSYAVDAEPADAHMFEPASARVSVAASSALAASEGSGEAATPNSALQAADAEGSVLASALAGSTPTVISADVILNVDDPRIGSFMADGLTYAVNPDGLTLVAVDASAVSEDGNISIPETVAYNGITYDVTSIAPYAFYLSGATSVGLPASINSVDSRAFRSSDVEHVEVAAGNPNFASFDGALYSADLSRLLLIPEGRAGAVLLPETAEVVQASKFSHCSLVDAISVEEGGANFASWDGLLYDASGQTLLRVPAGATEITIRDGCTTIAAGALEGCASLERINAPASVTSISPDVFISVPTVSLPAASVLGNSQEVQEPAGMEDVDVAPMLASGQAETQMTLRDEKHSSVASGLPDQPNVSTSFIPQLTALVALSSTDDDLPEANPSAITIKLPGGASDACWKDKGFCLSASLAGEARPQGANSPALVQSAKTASANIINLGLGAFDGYYLYEVDWVPPSWDPNYKGRVGEKIFSTNGGTGMSGARLTFHADEPIVEWRNCNTRYVFDGAYLKWSLHHNAGLRLRGWGLDSPEAEPYDQKNYTIWDSAPASARSHTFYPLWFEERSVTFDSNGGAWSGDPSSKVLVQKILDEKVELPPLPAREGFRLTGWYDEAGSKVFDGASASVPNMAVDAPLELTLYARWERVDFDIGFDVDSEPDDDSYPGDAKEDQTVNVEDGPTAIEDPKRPGYVFQGWVIPTEDGMEAVDQELVYQDETDGKWYVDASKLPDYAGDDGRVELTARWTSVISVDVPQSVTFYADTVTQNQGSREGAASSAFGQNKVANQSQVDLRVVGLESSAVETTDTTLGADSILKKADAATPSTSAGKLLSLYPSAKQWTADELQDPEAVSNSKAADAVDFDLDDILLEKSFAADSFTIPAGDTLNMGYRLNLTETGQQLDYDKLSTLEDGQSAALANVSYCFSAGAHFPTATGTKDDPLYIEYEGRVYGLQDIKDSAECISGQGTESPCYGFYKKLLDAQVMNNGNPGAGPYFQVKVDGVYLPLQLIGIYQDTKSDGSGKAGLTFQLKDLYAYNNFKSAAAGAGSFKTQMYPTYTNAGGWEHSTIKNQLRTIFLDDLDAALQLAIAPVDKFQQQVGGATAAYLQKTANETIWLPSMYEVFGDPANAAEFANYNPSEALTGIAGYEPFQYQAYQGNSGATANTRAVKKFNDSADLWWVRSAYRNNTNDFCGVNHSGGIGVYTSASSGVGIAPCFCL